MSTLDATGLTIDRLPEARERIAARMRTLFGDDVACDDESSVVGKLTTILAETSADQNESVEGVYNSLDVNAAVGVPQDKLCAYNGITRNGAQYSTVPLTLIANSAGCTAPLGTLFKNPMTNDVWRTDAQLVLAPFATGVVTATAVVAGAIAAPPGSITEFGQSVYGLDSVTNLASAVLGAVSESHSRLRSRRTRASRATGTSTLPAIKAALEDIDNVSYAEVYANNSASIDEYGIPPGHIWAIVGGGTAEDIGAALFAHVSCGMFGAAHIGVEYGGHVYVMSYSVPVDVPVYLTLRIKPAQFLQGLTFPINGAALIKAAVVAWFDQYQTAGVDVATKQLYVPANAIPGYYLDSVCLGTSPGPTASDDLALLLTQRATVTADSIVVEVVG